MSIQLMSTSTVFVNDTKRVTILFLLCFSFSRICTKSGEKIRNQLEFTLKSDEKY